MGANALASTVSSAIERLGLTYEEVGGIVDASARSVARWTSGQVVPQRLNKQRLIELAYVADALAEEYVSDVHLIDRTGAAMEYLYGAS